MAESISRPTTAALTATVAAIGAQPTISRTLADAPVAELGVTFSGGTAGEPVIVTLVVTLNLTAGLAPAQLIDEAQPTVATLATIAGNAYTFENVKFPAPGTAATRRFRITNVRVDATKLSASSLTPVQAAVSIRSSTPIRLSNAEQTVAIVS